MSVPRGMVYLVGAGPGDPDLLTVRASDLLDEADVILHDALVGNGVTERFPPDASIEHVGKRPGGDRTPQDVINRRMITEAERGKVVVRLKGGDPTVFGRGGEEAEALAAAGVPFEFVPGVTSALAAPSVAGIPLTHREHASSLTVITGHEDPLKPESALDWPALAQTVATGGTLVILMGVGRLADNVAALVAHEVSPETPAAMIERATLSDEFAVTGTLATIEERVNDTGIEPPATTVIGEVVGVGDRVEGQLGGATGRWRAQASNRESGVNQPP